MNIDKFGNVILDQDELFNLIYAGKTKDFSNIYTDDTTCQQFNKAINHNRDAFVKIPEYKLDPFVDLNFFDEANQCDWFMPEEYQNFPIVDWIYEQCTTAAQKTRVDEELKLYIQHGMFEVLHYLKYLVDTMRKNNIVWGVGRGSSVASYILYLMGVHKIDSMKYELDIKEFLN